MLRDRLTARAAELARRAEALNRRRAEEFGAPELRLTATERLRTERTAVPRDVVAVGDVLLLGYEPRPRPDRDITVGDVLAAHDRGLNRLPDDAVPGLLDDPAFLREFAALHRYYRQARLLRLRRVEGKLLAVFQTGEKAGDIRVLRWSVTDDGHVTFLDARGDRDHAQRPPADIEWTPATREDHVLGRHPHVSVRGEVFVDTLGGTLTVKAENDTGTPDGIHSEPVDEPLQSLADADIAHARVGPLILLRVLPYKETAHRHLVFNTLTRTVVRLDGIGQGCRRLPEDQGIVFAKRPLPRPFTGHKTYDLDTEGMEFEREVRSPVRRGRALRLPRARPRTRPAALLQPDPRGRRHPDGLPRLGPLRRRAPHPAASRGRRTRARAPRAAVGHALPVRRPRRRAAGGEGPLARVGNADLVRGVSDCLSLARAAAETTPTAEIYATLAAACVRALDTHHWLGDPEVGDLRTPLEEVRATAEQVLAEFETVTDLTRRAAEALDEAAERITAVVRRLRGEQPREAAAWVRGLTELRQAQGHLLTLKEMRYADHGRIDALAAEADDDLASFGHRAVAFLAREDAFAAHHAALERLHADIEAVTTTAGAAPLAARLDELADGLRTVTEVVAGLDIADATVRTGVLERVADALGGVNRARAILDTRRRSLLDREARAGFAAELTLLGQTVTGALAAAGDPDACDDQMARVLAQLEELESRFAEFDEVLGNSPTAVPRSTTRSPPASRPSPTPAPAAPHSSPPPPNGSWRRSPAAAPPSPTPTR